MGEKGVETLLLPQDFALFNGCTVRDKAVCLSDLKALMCGAGDLRWFLLGRNSAAAAKSLQSCLTVCDPMDGSPPGPNVPGILQARTLEWVAISSSNA